jgi:hypothetical protein
MLDKTTARQFIAPRPFEFPQGGEFIEPSQGAKLRIFSEFSELGVFARVISFPIL